MHLTTLLQAALFLVVVGTGDHSAGARQQPRTVFAGVPSLKVSEGGVERRVDELTRTDAANLHCVISEIDGRFYWASRENNELRRHAAGAFVTFTAVDGAGYVRVLQPEMKRAAVLMWPSAEKFDYVEHVLTGLNSVTYYGATR